MVTLPTLGEVIEELFDQLLAQYLSVFQKWWDDVSDSLQSLLRELRRFPPRPLRIYQEFARHLTFIVVRFFTLLNELLTAPIGAAYATLLQIAVQVVPKEWNTSVLTKKKAWLDCCEAIITGSQEAGSLNLPLGGRVYIAVARIRAIVGVRGGGIAGLARFFVGTIATIILKVIDIFLKLFAVIGVVICVLIFWRFARDVVAGNKLVTFQQETQRRKWFGAPKGLPKRRIYRRDPGGNPP